MEPEVLSPPQSTGTPDRPDDAPSGLTLRYRPHRFADMVGQRHVAAVLKEAVRADSPPQQILLAGGSGLGKTTAARIFAAALLCELPAQGDACGGCGNCLDVAAGTHPDVIEMDAASNGGKDEVNELAARARTMPLRGRWKVYIVDEAHGLTRAGGEAFLKLLEEPPEHVVFLLATTDPDKMLSTNRGRCLELEVLPPSTDELADHLVDVAAGEGWALPPDAAAVVVERSDPRLGVRGTVMSLAKLSGPLARGEELTGELLSQYLGWLPQQRVDALVALIEAHELAPALDTATELARSHGDAPLRQALVAWARRSLREGSERAVWRLETIAATPPGALWTEALVAKLTSPAFDGSTAAAAALVEEARSTIADLEAATVAFRDTAAEARAATPAAPVSAAPAAPPTPNAAADGPTAVTSGTAAGESAPRVPAGDDGPPLEAYEPPPEWEEGWDDQGPPPTASRRRTGQPAKRTDGNRRSGNKAGGNKASGNKASGNKAESSAGGTNKGGANTSTAPAIATTPPTGAPVPGAAAGPDPWFDNPDAYDTRPQGDEPPAAVPPSGATPPPAAVNQDNATQPAGVPPAEPEQVLASLRATGSPSATLLEACRLLERDGTLYVIVPAHLAAEVRASSLPADLEALLPGVPVKYRRHS